MTSHFDIVFTVDGGWSEWTEWTNCSVTCWTARSRECDNPAPLYFGRDCQGDFNESMRCTDYPCDREYYRSRSDQTVLLAEVLKYSLSNILSTFINKTAVK